MVSPAVNPPRKILVICPICQGRGEIHVPDEVLQDNKGTSTVLVRAGVTCNHSYQVFVDKNCKVRGYQQTDYEVPIISKKMPAQQLFEGQNTHNPVITLGSTGSPRGGESEITIALREFITRIDGFLSCNICSHDMAELYDFILARKGFHVVLNDMKNWIHARAFSADSAMRYWNSVKALRATIEASKKNIRFKTALGLRQRT